MGKSREHGDSVFACMTSVLSMVSLSSIAATSIALHAIGAPWPFAVLCASTVSILIGVLLYQLSMFAIIGSM